LAVGVVTAAGAASAAPSSSESNSDPMAEVRHQHVWIDVEPGPEPLGLPLLGPEGKDQAGYPRQVVDAAALRSLLVNRKFVRLTAVLETFQKEFESNPRYFDCAGSQKSWIITIPYAVDCVSS